jgi:hypothetical protein
VEEVLENYKFPNSTGNFVPPYWMFGFKDNSFRSYLCITINIPSGVADEKYGLEGKLEAMVSPCCAKLTVACEWPTTLVDSSSLQDALSTEFQGTGGNGFGEVEGRAGTSSTISNILLAFETELQKIRTKNKVRSSYMLGSTCSINLPYPVERNRVYCTPKLDPSVESVNLYVVLKKQSTSKDELENNSMALQISNGYQRKFLAMQHTAIGSNSTDEPGYMMNDYKHIIPKKKY